MTSLLHRLFGPNRPQANTNARHRAILRKSLELFSIEVLAVVFGRPTNLRVVMGTAFGFFQLGKITSNYRRDGRVVFRETDIPDLEARHALLAYLGVYDLYFTKRGNDYRVRDPDAKVAMQEAEQRWHDWVVAYLAARGRFARPDWALEPLPGLDRVRIVQPAPGTPRAVIPLRTMPRLALPTPPPSSPVRGNAKRSLEVIDISDDEDVDEPLRGNAKRSLEVIDISDDEDVDARPLRKKGRFLGAFYKKYLSQLAVASARRVEYKGLEEQSI
ncbi:hypothetical protein GGX14DRAFT_395436 [Mycena pura]|uniref:Uncharacterized protein n=1 Tax=Mycena pura TaxID=153505 RepID=A0AAD6VK89_9AGAR|nr:hypothetical protein GGX14DRAFT_395436 [Mycena pura]